MKVLLFCIAACGVVAGFYGMSLAPDVSALDAVLNGSITRHNDQKELAQLVTGAGFGIAVVFGIGGFVTKA